MIEDKLLILRFKQGRHEALRQIYDKYKVELLRLAVVLIGDVSTAEDMVHDVFVKFARSADRIKLTGNLKNYLVTSVINRVRNYLRDSKRHRETDLDGAESLAAAERGPRQWAVLDEQLTLLSKALQELPYEQREVICFRMEMDMTFRQIAMRQNASVKVRCKNEARR
ncbi:MAG: RNA polymerase sigma factor [Planctomycetota bacterium]|jgi:RNA polymerase sigma factor (sigma-70 family)